MNETIVRTTIVLASSYAKQFKPVQMVELEVA